MLLVPDRAKLPQKNVGGVSLEPPAEGEVALAVSPQTVSQPRCCCARFDDGE